MDKLSSNKFLFFCSFYNWETQVSSSNPSPNFEVIYKACHGLLFMSTNSGKILDVDPWVGSSLRLLLLWFIFKGEMSANHQIACSVVVKHVSGRQRTAFYLKMHN